MPCAMLLPMPGIASSTPGSPACSASDCACSPATRAPSRYARTRNEFAPSISSSIAMRPSARASWPLVTSDIGLPLADPSQERALVDHLDPEPAGVVELRARARPRDHER